MSQILQWSTLVVCGIVALIRIPSAIRGENRSLFYIFVLATFAMLLSLDPSYRAFDSWLGSQNYANLILRFVVYVAILLAGHRIARGFDAPRSVRLITGPIGLTVLGLIAVSTVALFLMADTAGTDTGLNSLPARSPLNAQFVSAYAAAGRLYPSFIAACILPATLRAIRTRLPLGIRSGAVLLSVAFVGMIAGSFFPLIPRNFGFIEALVNYTAVLTLVLGLTVIWLARVTALRARSR